MGYYASWQTGMYPAGEVDFSSITHLMVFAALPRTDGSLDLSSLSFASSLNARAHSFGRKSILTVGGAGTYNAFAAATSATNRDRFIANLVQASRDLGFDGIDIDWEPLQDQDLPNYKELIIRLRQAMPNGILTSAVMSYNPNYQVVPATFAEVAPYLDRIGLMTYEMAGAYQGWLSWHASALYGGTPQTPLTVLSAVNGYVSAGVPREKLAIGVGFYGQCWNSPVTGPMQQIGSARVVAGDNTMSYANIMKSYYSANVYRYDSTAEAPYLSSSTPMGPQGCTFVSYEDQRSLTAKGSYVKAQGLGGAIIWTANQGYISSGATADERNSLLRSLAGAMK